MKQALCIGLCAAACAVACLQPDPIVSVSDDDGSIEAVDTADTQFIGSEPSGGAECLTASGAPYITADQGPRGPGGTR